MKLYEISESIRHLLDEHAQGAIDDTALVDMLEQVNEAFDAKARAVAAYALELDAQAEAIADVIEDMERRLERTQRRANGLRQYLHAQMAAVGKTKIEMTEFTISIRKNPPRVIIDDYAGVPANFMTTPPPLLPRPNLMAIKDMLKELKPEETCEFAHLTQGDRLEIKT